ncbi:hypothetical protein [Bacillus sp. AK128]
MFDPTIFDNLKVVVEGAVYDRDLEGELTVINRKDMIDLATMSRHYLITFKLPDQTRACCSWELASTVSQLSSELLVLNKEKMGCSTEITFKMDLDQSSGDVTGLQSIVSNVWGDREIKTKIISDFPETGQNEVEIKLIFNRTIQEEDIDDLLDMFHYMEKTLHLLQANGY